AAVINNYQAADWKETSLSLRGGSKTGTGNWVRLPDNLLPGATSATISTEVKPSASMLSSFHFIWSIGAEESTNEYIFTSVNCGNNRTPLVGIKLSSEYLAQSPTCGVTANEWVNVTA